MKKMQVFCLMLMLSASGVYADIMVDGTLQEADGAIKPYNVILGDYRLSDRTLTKGSDNLLPTSGENGESGQFFIPLFSSSSSQGGIYSQTATISLKQG